MSWKCDICDTYNNERNYACYVCGERRSKESIILGTKRALVDFFARVNLAVCEKGYKVSLVMWSVAFSITVLAIAIQISIKIYNGDIYLLFENLSDVVNCAFYKFTDDFLMNVVIITENAFVTFFDNIGLNLVSILERFGDNLSDIPWL